MITKEKIILGLKILIIISILGLTFLIYCRQSEFTSLDLGRHLKNGQLVWQNRELLFKNFYSFTQADFAFINHHWLSGVIYWWLYCLGGFKLLTVFNIFIALLAVAIIFQQSVKRANFWLASILILPAILLLSERADIRPEMFSYLFLVATFYLLDKFRRDQNVKGWYWILIIQLFWVNMHIYFFIGLFLIGAAILEQIIVKNINFFKVSYCRKLFYLTLASIAVSLFNPNFIKGLVYPLNILKKYGYEIVENKSPFYLENLMINYNITIFKILAVILILSFVLSIFIKRKIIIFDLILALFFTTISFLAIRNLPLFGLMTLPVIALIFYDLKIIKPPTLNAPVVAFKVGGSLMVLITVAVVYAVVFLWLAADYHGERKYLKNNFGLGLESGSADSIKFYQDNKLTGPIFNNYDLGSALIFWLYPKEKVFVDNRPEAYSQEFFSQIYKPMAEEEEKWKEYREKYKINLIYFSHTDGTPWAREFLFSRLADEEWPLIYFDNYTVIMARKTENNLDLIKQYKITSDKFEQGLNDLKIGASKRNLMNLAGLAELFGRRDLAGEIYEQILKDQPNNGQVLTSLGYLFSASAKKEDIVKALDYFNKAIEAGFNLPAVYNQMGLDYWNLSDVKEAERMWQKALKIDRSNEHAKYYLKQLQELRISP